MKASLLLALALAACSKPANTHTLGDADQLKHHLQAHGCAETGPLGTYRYWFSCLRLLAPCGCSIRVTVRASDHDGSSHFLVDGLDADLRGCAPGVGFAEIYDLLDPLFPPPYRGAIHAFIRIPGHPAEGSPNPSSAVIQFTQFPGVSVDVTQRLDPKRSETSVSLNHYAGSRPPAYLDDPGTPQGCQR
ncbi:MAG: hypothetical protein ABI467_17345 [Kofleriaceae bacterium]